MTRFVLSVNKFDDINRAVEIISGKNVSGLPVVDRENRVVGIISEADLVSMIAMSEKADRKKSRTFADMLRHPFGEHVPERKMGHIVGDVMTSPARTIHPEAEMSEAVRVMDQYRIRRLPVVDKDQRLVGLITRADIVRVMGEKLTRCG
jgi:CBS domain-containing protein